MKEKTRLLVKDIGEIALNERISKLIRVPDSDVLVSVGDDAAVVKSASNFLQVLTTDILVENVHFRTDTHTPFDIGYKAIVANVSDIAAMAGLPRFALVSLGLDPHTDVGFVDDFYKGVLSAACEYGLTVVGGDTTKSSELIVSVVVIGQVEADMFRQRNGAEEGDQIVVTGSLGKSVAGLYLLSNLEEAQKITYSEELKKAHLSPKARIVEARIAAKEGAHAMEDISDGLASEIRHICKLSKAGARIQTDHIPIANGVKEVAELMKKDAGSLALYGGEDFELVFTVPKSDFQKIEREVQRKTGTKITVVGEVVSAEQGIALTLPNGNTTSIDTYGFEHF